MEGHQERERERERVNSSIWKIADALRGTVDGWDFKQYVLGALFYRFLSENLEERIDLNDRKLELFLNGVQLTHELEDNTYIIYNKNKFIGLGIVKNNLLKRDIVI